MQSTVRQDTSSKTINKLETSLTWAVTLTSIDVNYARLLLVMGVNSTPVASRLTVIMIPIKMLGRLPCRDECIINL